jgi:hypothetical protein
VKFKVGDRVTYRWSPRAGTVDNTQHPSYFVRWDDKGRRSGWFDKDFLTPIEPEYEYVESWWCLYPGKQEPIMHDRGGTGCDPLYRRVPKHVHDFKRVCSCGESQ